MLSVLEVIVAASAKVLSEGMEDIITQCQTELEQLKNKEIIDYTASEVELVGILLSSHEHEKEQHCVALQKLIASFPNIQIVGCSAVGTLNSAIKTPKDEGLTLVLFIFHTKKIKIYSGVVEDISFPLNLSLEQAQNVVVKKVKEKLITIDNKNIEKTKFYWKLCMIFPAFIAPKEISQKNHIQCVSSIIKGIQNSFRAEKYRLNCKILGGLATGHLSVTKMPEEFLMPNIQFFNEEVYENGMPFLIFSGSGFECYSSFGNGVEEKEKEWLKVKMDGLRIDEIEGQSPNKFLSKHPATNPELELEWPFNPIILQHVKSEETKSEETKFNRDLYFKDGEFYIPDSSFNQMNARIKSGICTESSVRESVRNSMERLYTLLKNKDSKRAVLFKPKLLLVFSCVTRAWAFVKEGISCSIEHEYIKTALCGEEIGNLPTVMFYCFGEIGNESGVKGTKALSSTEYFHSTTMFPVLLGEIPPIKKEKPQNIEKEILDLLLILSAMYDEFSTETQHKLGKRRVMKNYVSEKIYERLKKEGYSNFRSKEDIKTYLDNIYNKIKDFENLVNK